MATKSNMAENNLIFSRICIEKLSVLEIKIPFRYIHGTYRTLGWVVVSKIYNGTPNPHTRRYRSSLSKPVPLLTITMYKPTYGKVNMAA